MLRRFLLAIAGLVLLPMAAMASPITYIYSGSASGSLDSVDFSDAGFVITAQADTDHIGPWFDGTLQNTHLSATVALSGFGSFSFSDATHTWIAEDCCMGIGKDFSFNYLTLFTPDIVSVGYDLAMPVGPIYDPSASTQGQFVDIGTSGGALTFASVSDVSFQAIAVPEPGTYALMAFGLAGVVAVRRRRKSTRA